MHQVSAIYLEHVAVFLIEASADQLNGERVATPLPLRRLSFSPFRRPGPLFLSWQVLLRLRLFVDARRVFLAEQGQLRSHLRLQSLKVGQHLQSINVLDLRFREPRA